jgi:hypothetical protein
MNYVLRVFSGAESSLLVVISLNGSSKWLVPCPHLPPAYRKWSYDPQVPTPLSIHSNVAKHRDGHSQGLHVLTFKARQCDSPTINQTILFPNHFRHLSSVLLSRAAVTQDECNTRTERYAHALYPLCICIADSRALVGRPHTARFPLSLTFHNFLLIKN